MSLKLFTAELSPEHWGLIGMWLMNKQFERLRSEFAEKNTPNAVARLDQMIAAIRPIGTQPAPLE